MSEIRFVIVDNMVMHYIKFPKTKFRYVFRSERSRQQHEQDDVKAWCTEQFGPSVPGDARWLTADERIAFLTESDAVAFKMRWC